eukprot:jgi/Psemu1/215927/e_gw1.768.18.1
MGNVESAESSLSGASALTNERDPKVPLAMMAVSRKIFLHKGHIGRLRNAMAHFSDDLGMITREGFDKALEMVNVPGAEVFDLLFTMWDNADDGKVSSKQFCRGISPLACAFDDLSSTIRFALRISDESHRGRTNKKELYELLFGINSTASYFGDSHLLQEEIEIIVDTVFEEGGEKSHTECIRKLVMNPYVRRFASGKKRSRVAFKKALVTEYIFEKDALVTEYVLDNIEALAISAAYKRNNHNCEPGESRDDNNLYQEYQLPLSENGTTTSSLDERESLEVIATAQNRDPPSSDTSYDRYQACTELRDPPSSNSYSTYERKISMPISRDPPSRMNE